MQFRMIQFPSVRLHVGSLIDFKRRKAAIKEPETVEWLRTCLADYGPYTLVDVGANVGGYSLIACALGERNRAIAVEPFPPTFLTLCRNIAANRLDERIVPLNGLIGNGTATGTIPLSFDAWRSGVAEHAPQGRFRLQLPTVDGTHLARYLGDATSIICKIDVDGAEVNVVEALTPLLADRRLKSILIECEDATRGPIERMFLGAGFAVASSHGKENQRQVNLIAHRGPPD